MRSKLGFFSLIVGLFAGGLMASGVPFHLISSASSAGDPVIAGAGDISGDASSGNATASLGVGVEFGWWGLLFYAGLGLIIGVLRR